MQVSENKHQRKSPTSWEDLEVWQLAHGLVLKVYEVTRAFPRDERFRLIDQLCRAAASVPTNIAEGRGRASAKDFARFVSIARGSVEETKYLLLLANDLGYLDGSDCEQMRQGYDRVGMMLNRLMGALNRRSGSRPSASGIRPSEEE